MDMNKITCIKQPLANNHGFTLVLALSILLMLSLFGIWALNTSISELYVASGTQQIEEQFNIIEGAAYTEAAKVGFSLKSYYQVTDPSKMNHILTPITTGDFDPGSDAPDTAEALDKVIHSPSTVPANENYWPWENLMRDTSDDDFDYRYLVTYISPDAPPLGYDAGTFSSYKFRIQAASPDSPIFVELGGKKIGPAAGN